jgi:hypothetical protein
MNLEALTTVITKETLLAKYSQEMVMEFYFEQPVRLGKFYCNPFREDKTPGCRFFYTRQGFLVFNDFSINKQYNCFQVAALRTGKSITANEINSQMGGVPTKSLPKPTIRFFNEEEKQSNTTISVKIMPYTQADLEYWAQFNIGLSTLKKFNVRKVEKAWINGVLKYIDLKSDPCYRYQEGDRIKLYRPNSRKNKFRNNYTEELEGIKHIPEKGSKLIITKALKDVMTFDSIGLLAVCPRSETSLISEEVMDDLLSRFDEVFIWFDSDPTGVERSIILYEKYKEQGLIRLTHSEFLAKDTSDIVKLYGVDKLIELCKQCEIL